jgi:MFS family permease
LRQNRTFLLGIMLISMAILNLEIALTRVFSVFMWYHFAFLTISLALLGSGVAGVWVYLMSKRFSREEVGARLTVLAALFGFASVGAFVVYLQIPFNVQTFRQGLGWDIAGWVALVYIVLAVPFLLGGAILSLAISRYSEAVGEIYFSDLAGASLGCLVSVAALNLVGGANAVLLVGVLGGLGAVLFSLQIRLKSARVLSIAAAIVLLGLLVSNLIDGPSRPNNWLNVRRRSGYEASHEIIYEKWNALSRITVYEDPGWLQPFGWGLSPVYQGADPGHLLMLIDSKAGTPIQKWTTGDWASLDFLRYDLTSIAYYVLAEPSTFIIGPGGGRDVLTGLFFGARKITGVELNPAIIDAAQNEFGEYAGHVYDQPQVRIEVEDARTYLARDGEHYDLIQASLIDTWAASSAGAFALSENSLYTREAFLTYYDRLTDEGILSFSRWYYAQDPVETLRMVTLGLDGWKRSGVDDPAAHIVVLANLAQNRSATEGLATMLLKKTPFTAEQVDRLAEISREMGFTVLYAPGLTPVPNAVHSLISAPDLRKEISSYALDISPPTDDRPFFFSFARPSVLLSAVYLDSPVLRANMEANRVLGVVLLISVGFTVLLGLGPLALQWSRRSGNRNVGPTDVVQPHDLLYFAALGMGFMLVEIPLIQRLTLYLGSPTYALVVVLFTILLSSGVGSLSTHRVQSQRALARLQWVIPILLAILVLHLVLLSPLLGWTQRWGLGVRLVVCIAAIAPTGYVMGQLFPLGIKHVRDRRPESIPWLWAINGAASVVGSSLATIIALQLGFRSASMLGIFCYVLSLLVSTLLWRKQIRQVELHEGLAVAAGSGHTARRTDV